MNIEIEKNSWGYYEIGFYQLSHDEKERIKNSVDMNRFDYLGYYYKSGEEWTNRISGMCFNITGCSYYSKLKIYLDKLLNTYLRKEKLLKLCTSKS